MLPLTSIEDQAADETRSGDWTQTLTGRRFWHMDPQPGDFSLQDIARGLSNECRFGGQVARFYSVAQHSLLVHHFVTLDKSLSGLDLLDARKWALLHDAAEAYMKDIPRPQKRWWGPYKAVEAFVQQQIAKRFEIPVYVGDHWPLPEAVGQADEDALITEAMLLYSDGRARNWTSVHGRDRRDELPRFWMMGAKKDTLVCYTPDDAMDLYISVFKEVFEMGAAEW